MFDTIKDVQVSAGVMFYMYVAIGTFVCHIVAMHKIHNVGGACSQLFKFDKYYICGSLF